jgi:8-oxo-dGTP diphosphatase
MVDQSAYPVLSGTTQASWAPIDLRFELLTGEADPDRIARVYVVPFIGAACVVVGFEHGDWGPVGGGREPGESVRAALERELAEEAGGRLLTYRPFAALRCHSRAPAPYRPMSRIPTTTEPPRVQTLLANSSCSVCHRWLFGRWAG